MPIIEVLSKELVEEIAVRYPNLETLNLSRNAIARLEGLDPIAKGLVSLNMDRNRLGDLNGMECLRRSKLNMFSAAHNRLTDICGVEVIANSLTRLDVSGNRLRDAERTLRALKTLRRLEHLNVKDNPLYNQKENRGEMNFDALVLKAMPHLITLNGISVTEYAKRNETVVHDEKENEPRQETKSATKPIPIQTQSRVSDGTQRHVSYEVNETAKEQGKRSNVTSLSDRADNIASSSSSSSSHDPLTLALAVVKSEDQQQSVKHVDAKPRYGPVVVSSKHDGSQWQIAVARAEAQCASMAKLMRIQEREMATAATDVRVRRRGNSRETMTSDAIESDRRAAQARAFERLLQRWRRELFATMVRGASDRRRTEIEAAKVRDSLRDTQARLTEATRALEHETHRRDALDKEISLLRSAAVLRDTAACERDVLVERVKDRIARDERTKRTLRRCLSTFRGHMRQEYARVERALRTLSALDQRARFAIDRLHFLRTMRSRSGIPTPSMMGDSMVEWNAGLSDADVRTLRPAEMIPEIRRLRVERTRLAVQLRHDTATKEQTIRRLEEERESLRRVAARDADTIATLRRELSEHTKTEKRTKEMIEEERSRADEARTYYVRQTHRVEEGAEAAQKRYESALLDARMENDASVRARRRLENELSEVQANSERKIRDEASLWKSRMDDLQSQLRAARLDRNALLAAMRSGTESYRDPRADHGNDEERQVVPRHHVKSVLGGVLMDVREKKTDHVDLLDSSSSDESDWDEPRPVVKNVTARDDRDDTTTSRRESRDNIDSTHDALEKLAELSMSLLSDDEAH